MGYLGPLLTYVIEQELEKRAGIFRSPTAYERFAQTLRRYTSMPVNPYSIATAPMQSAARKFFRGGLRGVGHRLWRGALGGMMIHEFISGLKKGLAANRRAIQTWGL